MRAAADALGPERVRALFVETPANPNIEHSDIAAIAAVGRELSAAQAHDGPDVVTIVDNTLLGPVFQRPATLGADIVVYSATKFLGGHSDLVAGVATGPEALMRPIRDLRTILGTVTTPFNGWLLLRSLETVSIRMRRQSKTARRLARLLADHPRVTRVLHPSMLQAESPQRELFERQCTGGGSLLAFEVEGGEAAAFSVARSLRGVPAGGLTGWYGEPRRAPDVDDPRGHAPGRPGGARCDGRHDPHVCRHRALVGPPAGSRARAQAVSNGRCCRARREGPIRRRRTARRRHTE